MGIYSAKVVLFEIALTNVQCIEDCHIIVLSKSHIMAIQIVMKGEFIMKFLSKLRAGLRKNLLKNNAGQGATEYILLLVVIVGLVMAFKKPIMEKFDNANKKLGNDMDQVIQ